MSVVKNEIPILEYDTNPNAVIMPTRFGYTFPKKAVFPFLNDEIEQYAKLHNCPKIGEFNQITKSFPIYKAKHKGHDITLCQAPQGASAAVQFLDFLIGSGVHEIITIGSCGVLNNLAENEILVPTAALRDEGVSYHYLPPQRTVELNPKAVKSITKALDNLNINYRLCKTWTTDGFYRETAEMVDYRRNEGCDAVEMECAGLAACAQFRGAVFGQILYTADSLADTNEWDERYFGANSMKTALNLALESVVNIT